MVNNEEESDTINLLNKDDGNYKKTYIKSKIFLIYHNEESKKKKKSRDDASVGIGRNDNEEINFHYYYEENAQKFCFFNNDINAKEKDKNPEKNYPFNSSKINNLINEENKFKYKNKIIIFKKSMVENLEEF